MSRYEKEKKRKRKVKKKKKEKKRKEKRKVKKRKDCEEKNNGIFLTCHCQPVVLRHTLT
jgi:hypothetical protein